MTEAWEASVEAKIQDAVQRGEFDDLPGMGKPIPGRGAPYDEAWWIKSFLEREALPSDLLLPTSLQLRRRIEQVPDEVRGLPTEQSVRDFVGQLNAQIVAWLRFPDGPPGRGAAGERRRGRPPLARRARPAQGNDDRHRAGGRRRRRAGPAAAGGGAGAVGADPGPRPRQTVPMLIDRGDPTCPRRLCRPASLVADDLDELVRAYRDPVLAAGPELR